MGAGYFHLYLMTMLSRQLTSCGFIGRPRDLTKFSLFSDALLLWPVLRDLPDTVVRVLALALGRTISSSLLKSGSMSDTKGLLSSVAFWTKFSVSVWWPFLWACCILTVISVYGNRWNVSNNTTYVVLTNIFSRNTNKSR